MGRNRFGTPPKKLPPTQVELDRWDESVRASAGLPISPRRARELLDGGMTHEQVRAHVEAAVAAGRAP